MTTQHNPSGMQFGVFTIGDVTTDPMTGRTPSENERIKATVAIARKAEEVGLDVFATGQHHNLPFIARRTCRSCSHIAAQTERILLSTATTITTTDPVRSPRTMRIRTSPTAGWT